MLFTVSVLTVYGEVITENIDTTNVVRAAEVFEETFISLDPAVIDRMDIQKHYPRTTT